MNDTYTKEFMRDNKVFADGINFLVFDGEQVVEPDDLHELDTTEISLPYGDDSKSKAVQRFRDVLKFASLKEDSNAAYLVLGIENQMNVHNAMPVRNMLYDALQYTEQVEKIRKQHIRNGDTGETSDEFLSGFYNSDKILPVITVVVFFGADEWTGPRSVHEMLTVKNKKVLDFTPDYKLNLIAPHDIENADFEKFHSDLGTVLKYIKYSNSSDELQEQLDKDKRFHSVPRRTAELINRITNSNLDLETGKEDIDMCDAIKGIIAKSKTEGRAEGRAERDTEIAENLRKLGISEDIIKKATENK